MVAAKNELFDKDLQACADFFKALAHPARLQILKYLAETKTCITGDISDELPLSRTTVSQHLRELKETGLVRGEIDGSRTNYCLVPEKIQEMESAISQLLSKIKTECANSIKC